MVQKFVTNMRDKVKSMRKEEEGFSLVELIVVIVILAILIGVTIGGVYKYVNQSRVNTDVNNAATIQSTLSTLGVDKDVYKWASAETAPSDIVITWDASKTVAEAIEDTVVFGTGIKVEDKIAALLTDGFPAPKAGGAFKLTFKAVKKNLVVTCKAYSDTACTAGNELKGQDN